MAERNELEDGARPLPALRLADKLERLQPDEMVLVRRDGRIMSRSQRRIRQVAVIGGIGAVCAVMIATTPVLGLTYTAMLGGFIGIRLRGIRLLNQVPRLIRVERFDEAERVIARLERGSWRQRAMAAYGRMMIAFSRGELDAALGAADRCAQLLPGPDRFLYAVYWASAVMRASLLLELGRDGADAAFARAMQAPAGEIYAVMKRDLEALRAFVRDRPDELGDDEALHARATEALRYNHTGMTVALYAWAFERRGDAEMSAHLVAEVPSRCQHGVERIARAHPRVWAWLGPKLEAVQVQQAADE